MSHTPVEKLRRIWTPEREVEEIFTRLDPGTWLDSIIRDYLHRVIQQKGPVALDLDVRNEGTLRWEVVKHDVPGGRTEVSIWIE
jgi:hypothetical protein